VRPTNSGTRATTVGPAVPAAAHPTAPITKHVGDDVHHPRPAQPALRDASFRQAIRDSDAASVVPLPGGGK
jgi:hypothetical protein